MAETSRSGMGCRVPNAGREEGAPQASRRRLTRRLLCCSLWGLGLAALILSLAVLWGAVARSPLFVVKQVEIEGSERVGPDEVRSISGIRYGLHLLSLDTAEASHRLEAHPWIQHAAVVKRLPERVLIKIREKRPAMLVRVEGSLFYMDGEGRVMDRIQPGGSFDLPMLTGLEEVGKGARCCGNGRDVQQALSLLRSLQATSVLGSVSEIHVDRSEGLDFVLEGWAVPVKVGWSDFSTELDRFQKVLPFLATQLSGIEGVDLRFSGQVVVRQRQGGRLQVPREDRTKTLAGTAPPFHQTT